MLLVVAFGAQMQRCLKHYLLLVEAGTSGRLLLCFSDASGEGREIDMLQVNPLRA